MRVRTTRRAALILLLAAFAVLPIGCAGSRVKPPHKGVASLWKGYTKMEPHRAVAIAGDPNGVWVGAASGGHASRLDAEQSVLSECRRSRANRRMRASCRLYASGSEILWKHW